MTNDTLDKIGFMASTIEACELMGDETATSDTAELADNVGDAKIAQEIDGKANTKKLEEGRGHTPQVDAQPWLTALGKKRTRKLD